MCVLSARGETTGRSSFGVRQSTIASALQAQHTNGISSLNADIRIPDERDGSPAEAGGEASLFRFTSRQPQFGGVVTLFHGKSAHGATAVPLQDTHDLAVDHDLGAGKDLGVPSEIDLNGVRWASQAASPQDDDDRHRRHRGHTPKQPTSMIVEHSGSPRLRLGDYPLTMRRTVDRDNGFRGSLRHATAAVILTMVIAAACSAPRIAGYQVQDVPGGFLFTANANDGGSLFPNRNVLSRGVWLGDVETFEPQSEIYVTRYSGNVTVDECETARDVQASRYGNPTSIDYGRVEPVTIDGRAAFAWMETRYDENGAVRSLDYTAVIPYDTVSYAVEFNTSAAHRLHPDSLTRVVHSWGRGETEVHWNVVLVVAVVLAGLAGLLVYWGRR